MTKIGKMIRIAFAIPQFRQGMLIGLLKEATRGWAPMSEGGETTFCPVWGSEGDTYLVHSHRGKLLCQCPGSSHRGHCKHIEEARKPPRKEWFTVKERPQTKEDWAEWNRYINWLMGQPANTAPVKLKDLEKQFAKQQRGQGRSRGTTRRRRQRQARGPLRSPDFMTVYGIAKTFLGRNKGQVIATLWIGANGNVSNMVDMLSAAKHLSEDDIYDIYPHIAASLSESRSRSKFTRL